MLALLGLDSSKYGEHSGRRGGATAASDAGVEWQDLMLHGRWKSSTTPLGYLANTRKRQRNVAKILSNSAVSSASTTLDSTVSITSATTSVSQNSLVSAVSSANSSDILIPSTSDLNAIVEVARNMQSDRSNSRYSFEPLSSSDWVQAKRRYTAEHNPPAQYAAAAAVPHRRYCHSNANSDLPSLSFVPRSSPVHIPVSRSASDLLAASTLATLSESSAPRHDQSEILTPTTLDALFTDDECFELMIL